MTTFAAVALPRSQRRRLITLGLLRSLGVSAGLVALYYLAPLDRLTRVPLWLALSVGLLALVAVSGQQVFAIVRSPYPGIRAIEALATTASLFLLLFAGSYFLIAQADAANFSTGALTRTDSLYFTVTVFTTVGFGDITATSQVTRLLVTVQMILDLIVLGLGIRVFIGAVRLGLQRPAQEGPSLT